MTPHAAARLARRARLGMGPVPPRRLVVPVAQPVAPVLALRPAGRLVLVPLVDRYRVRDVIGASADHFGVAVSDVLSPSRLGPLVRARQTAMYLAAEMTVASYVVRAREFHRDHTTLICGETKIARLVRAGDERTLAELAAIRRKLGL